MNDPTQRLVWIDLEMTGLNPDTDHIIEAALVVTEADLSVVAESPEWAIFQPESVLQAMDAWNQAHHQQSGLLERVRQSPWNAVAIEQQLLDFLAQHVPAGVSPMCGNSICQDRRFLVRQMPRLEQYFHYRQLDVSTLKELARRWAPRVSAGFTKQAPHRALADIHEAILELRHYREHFLRLTESTELP